MTPEEIELLVQERNHYLEENVILRNADTTPATPMERTRLTAENQRLRAEITYWKRHARKHEGTSNLLRGVILAIKATTESIEGTQND